MGEIQELFIEYARMRKNGLESREALRTLRPYIEPLPKNEKQELANTLRGWEAGEIDLPASAPPQTPPKPSVIKSLIKPVEGKPQTGPGGNDVNDEAVWTTCPNCNKKNRKVDVFCYSCGHILEPSGGQFDTRHFANATDDLFSADYFGPDSVLLLELRDFGQFFELRPQQRDHELIVGRSTGNSAMIPDVDLAEFKADTLGVSRLHLAIKYDGPYDTIKVYDLGSANGTYINGQKLHPKELRLIRHSDEIRLGRLIIRVYFNHPGAALD